MSVITKVRKQKAVLWTRRAADVHGKPTYTDPVEISCRWDSTQIQYLAPDGTLQLSSAVVLVDRDVQIGDVLREGTLDTVGDTVHPKINPGASEVKSFQKTPNFKATEFLRKAIL